MKPALLLNVDHAAFEQLAHGQKAKYNRGLDFSKLMF